MSNFVNHGILINKIKKSKQKSVLKIISKKQQNI